MAVTVLLLRHGQTRGNLERRYIGSTDEPLCRQGRRGLAAIAPALPPVDRVYASPLLRCRETAELLFPQRQAVIEGDLRECSFGAFEGRTYEELKDDPSYQAWLDSGGMAAPPGGESRSQQGARTVAAFLSLAQAWREGETVALAVHGGTIMAVLEALEECHDFYRWQVPNGGGYTCLWERGQLRDPKPLHGM